MKLLISGVGGLLGGVLTRVAKSHGHECLALNRSFITLSLDASDKKYIDSCFDGVDHFIHAAANTDVEGCQLNPSICYRDNVVLTELLVDMAWKKNVPVTFISSTGVYGEHKKSAWCEYDEPKPTTFHHHSKLLGEKKVLDANRSNLVVRTGWLFGGERQTMKNFVVRRIQEAQSTTSGMIFSNHQQHGCPTYADDLAQRILHLITLKANGIFNVVNVGSASRFEYVQEIIRIAALNIKVSPIGAGKFKRIAPVSDNEMALNWRSDILGLSPMKSWQEALADYMATDCIKELLR